MKELLEKDKLERSKVSKDNPFSQIFNKKKTPAQLVEEGIETVFRMYTQCRAPGVAKTCLQTLQTLIKNVLQNPDDVKFRRINLDKPAL